MSVESEYDTGAPTIDVRIYRDGRLLTRELCESEEDAAAIAERWSEVENAYIVVDDLSAQHGPDDVLAPEIPGTGDDAQPIAHAGPPGYGTE